MTNGQTGTCTDASIRRFEPGTATVLAHRVLAPNVHELTVEAPAVAAKMQVGQFIMLRVDEHSERIPLTVADWDPQAGWVTSIFLPIGTSTYKLAGVQSGDRLATFVGPLGKPMELGHFGTVLLVGGCYGIGGIYPIARALKDLGNQVYVLIEGRSAFLLYWLDRLRQVADGLLVTTKDGSMGIKEGQPGLVHELLASGERIDRVIAIGCTFMMYQIAKTTEPFGVKTIVSLNPIMIDGTGMCGACRVVVGGERKFACVDGPDFDAHEVDWDLLLARRKAYLLAETESAER